MRIPAKFQSVSVSDMAGSLLGQVGSAVVNVLYPKRCAVCGFRGKWVCDLCSNATQLFEQPWCRRCGVPFKDNACRCSRLPISVSMVRAVGPYEGWIRDSIHLVKYEGESDRGPYLAGFLSPLVGSMLRVDALVPVPLHAARLKERGFNQAELLAAGLSEETGLSVQDVLVRVRNTPHQVGLSAGERLDNVADAFEMAPDHIAAPGRVLLVDDVMTTGATLGECARILRANGASWVGALTVAA